MGLDLDSKTIHYGFQLQHNFILLYFFLAHPPFTFSIPVPSQVNETNSWDLFAKTAYKTKMLNKMH